MIENNKKYWIYAPGENASKWEEFYSDGKMAIGWDELMDNLGNYPSKEKIALKFQNYYKDGKSHKNDVLCCWNFYNNISIGDIIIAKKGRREYLGYGIVTSDYIYDKRENYYSHRRNVNWLLKGRWKSNHNIAIKTLTDITKHTKNVNYIINHLKIKPSKNISETKTVILNEDFVFTPGHNASKGHTHAQYSEKKGQIDLFHNRMLTSSYNQLAGKHTASNVGTENNSGQGTKIDIVVKQGNAFCFYEFKTSSNIKQCIREALPQLLEYAYWKKRNHIKKLIIVSQNIITDDAKAYLALLRKEFNLKIYYCQFNTKKEQLELDQLY